jgi:SPP1 gp7 family putative phage head morphogenesis protein
MTPAEAFLADVLRVVPPRSARPKRVQRAPRFPRRVEDRYRKALEALARSVSGEVADALRPVLARARAEEAGERTDAVDIGDAQSAIAQVRIAILRRISDRRIITLLEALSRDLSDANALDLAEVLGISIRDEPASIAALLEQWRTENVRLIKSIAEDLLGEVQEIVTEAVTRGTRVETLAKQIQRRFEVSRSRARLIARDQVAKANSQLTKIRHEAAGVSRYRWSSSQDERVRDSHRRLNRTVHAWNDPPLVDGRRVHPGEDYQCRCVAIPILED